MLKFSIMEIIHLNSRNKSDDISFYVSSPPHLSITRHPIFRGKVPDFTSLSYFTSSRPYFPKDSIEYKYIETTHSACENFQL